MIFAIFYKYIKWLQGPGMYKIDVGNQANATKIIQAVTSDHLTLGELDGLMKDYVDSVVEGSHKDHGK